MSSITTSFNLYLDLVEVTHRYPIVSDWDAYLESGMAVTGIVQ